jgi:hypothetical protein
MRIANISALPILILAAVIVFSFQGAGMATAIEYNANYCDAKCRCAWGLFQACMDCRQRCERARWKQFDREMNELGKSDTSDSRR